MAWSSAALGAVMWAVFAISPAAAGTVEAGGKHVSADVRQAADWIARARDNRGFPFAVVDKRNAHLYVFDKAGALRGATVALVGQTPGDEIAPEVGKHAAMGNVPVAERTTPAGRFVSQPGRNLHGEHVVWVDYHSAFAIHRLRPGASRAPRAARLATPTPADNRVSLGCVIVPVQFYTRVVQQVLGQSRAIVYVLPESGSLQDLFNSN